MKIAIFTTITEPDKYQYAWREALANYCEFADYVVVVDGSDKPVIEESEDNPKIRVIHYPWPEKWDWSELPKHLNSGLENALMIPDVDWVIKMDIDYLIHEADFLKVRLKLQTYMEVEIPVAYFIKLNVMNREHGYEKSVLPLAMNVQKALEFNIQYGIATDDITDWCYPILVRGLDKKWDIFEGPKVSEKMMLPLGINIYNYDYFFRTKRMAKKEYHRFSRAYATAFDWSWGETPKKSFEIFVSQMKGRLKRAGEIGALKDVFHPKHISERIQRMTPDEFGYNNWNNFENL